MTPKRKLKNDENLFVFKAQTQIDKINCQDAMVELEGDLELELSNLMDITNGVREGRFFSILSLRIMRLYEKR